MKLFSSTATKCSPHSLAGDRACAASQRSSVTLGHRAAAYWGCSYSLEQCTAGFLVTDLQGSEDRESIFPSFVLFACALNKEVRCKCYLLVPVWGRNPAKDNTRMLGSLPPWKEVGVQVLVLGKELRLCRVQDLVLQGNAVKEYILNRDGSGRSLCLLPAGRLVLSAFPCLQVVVLMRPEECLSYGKIFQNNQSNLSVSGKYRKHRNYHLNYF